MNDLGVEPEYVELVSPDTLEPVSELDKPALLAIAARVGSIRLIDNVTLDPAAQINRRAGDPNRLAVDPNRLAVDLNHSVAHPEPATPREIQAICSV